MYIPKTTGIRGNLTKFSFLLVSFIIKPISEIVLANLMFTLMMQGYSFCLKSSDLLCFEAIYSITFSPYFFNSMRFGSGSSGVVFCLAAPKSHMYVQA
jgi:hypothetical protein